MNDELRKKCKELKIFQNVPYSEIAALLDIKKNSFYNWLKGYYNLSETRQEQLKEILSCLKQG